MHCPADNEGAAARIPAVFIVLLDSDDDSPVKEGKTNAGGGAHSPQAMGGGASSPHRDGATAKGVDKAKKVTTKEAEERKEAHHIAVLRMQMLWQVGGRQAKEQQQATWQAEGEGEQHAEQLCKGGLKATKQAKHKGGPQAGIRQQEVEEARLRAKLYVRAQDALKRRSEEEAEAVKRATDIRLRREWPGVFKEHSAEEARCSFVRLVRSLGMDVPSGANKKLLKSQYRLAMMKYHPDKQLGVSRTPMEEAWFQEQAKMLTYLYKELSAE